MRETLATATSSLSRLGCSSLLVTGDFNFRHASYTDIDVDGGSATVAHIDPSTKGVKAFDKAFLECLTKRHLFQMVTFPMFQNSDAEAAAGRQGRRMGDRRGAAGEQGEEAPMAAPRPHRAIRLPRSA